MIEDDDDSNNNVDDDSNAILLDGCNKLVDGSTNTETSWEEGLGYGGGNVIMSSCGADPK